MSSETTPLIWFRGRLCLCASAVLLPSLAFVPQARADVATKVGEKSKDKKDDKSSDKKKESDYLPEARNVSARFVAGQTVDIELLGSVSSLKQIEFVVRQVPQNGVLSAPRPHPRDTNKAIITYAHRAADGPLSDAFTYACRVSGGAWSAPGTVTLTGQRMEPRLEVEGVPAFGRVFLGGEITARVVVKNTGTEDARLKLTWPDPWSGPPSLAVAKGGSAEFVVLFRPRKPGEFRHDILLQPGQQASRVVFFAECVQAFSASPGSLVLKVDAATGQRAGMLTLSNSRPEPVRAVFTLPSRVQGPAETEVAASSKIDVRLFLPVNDVEAFSGELDVRAGDDVQKIILEARPKPAEMQLLAPRNGDLQFGTVTLGATATREVTIGNAGGEPLYVEARTRAPFHVGSAVASMRIEPRTIGTLKVAIEPDKAGIVLGELELVSSTARVVAALRAEVRDVRMATPQPETTPAPKAVPPSGAPPVIAAPPEILTQPQPQGEDDALYAMRSPGHAAIMAIMAAGGLPLSPKVINPYLDPVRGVELIATAPTEVTIAWKKPALPPSGWAVDFATMVFDKNTGFFTKMWRRHRDWEHVEAGTDKVGLRLHALKPSSQYEVRVMGVDREGKLSEPSPVLLIHTAEPWRVPSWVWRLLIAIALGFVGRLLFRLRRGDFMAEPAH